MKRILVIGALSCIALGACSSQPGEKAARNATSAIDDGPWTLPGVYTASSATWTLSEFTVASVEANENQVSVPFTTFAYGQTSDNASLEDVPVAGHWKAGDTSNSIGVFRPAGAPWNPCGAGGAEFLLRDTPTAGSPDNAFCYGGAQDIPVVGDWGHNGFTTVGVFRPAGAPYNSCAPGNAEWILSTANAAGAPTTSFCYGGPGDVPVVGDWNGDGYSKIGVFRKANATYNYCTPGAAEWILSSSHINTSLSTNNVVSNMGTICYGGAGDIPITGDWNNDGFDSIGVFRTPNTAYNSGPFDLWLAHYITPGKGTDFQFYFGWEGDSTDQPIVGNWAPGSLTTGCSPQAVATAGGVCAACGEDHELACTNNVCFTDIAPIINVNGTCLFCGAAGEPACKGNICNEGQASVGGTCGPCGAVNQTACVACGGSPSAPPCPLANGGCELGTVNARGTCECGAISQPFCETTGSKCASCASGACPVGTLPDGAGILISNGLCTECGTKDALPCTNGNACASGLALTSGKCETPAPPPPPPCVPTHIATVTVTPSANPIKEETPFSLDVAITTGECNAIPPNNSWSINVASGAEFAAYSYYPIAGFAPMPDVTHLKITNIYLPHGQYIVEILLGKIGDSGAELGQSVPFTVE